MSRSLLTRIAPTPSGYLHLGNLANFLLVEKLARERGATILLRIDDCDGTRARREYVEHVFDTLWWLGIEWQEGPRDANDFYARFSQVVRKAFYFEKLAALSALTYACTCSRKEAPGIYTGACREKKLPFVPGKTALRLRVEDPALAKEFGDVVLWRKDDGPAYQWVSVVDDLEWGVGLIVRGEDLRPSSELQKYIAGLAKPGGFAGVEFVHHPLLTDEAGQKLAKSAGSFSVKEMREACIAAEALRARIEGELRSWRR